MPSGVGPSKGRPTMRSLRSKLSTESPDRGATMVEYGIMVALVAVIVLVAVGPFGQAVSTLFTGLVPTL